MKTVGVFLARMQPVHKAHLFMVTKACEECDEVCVILGSENKKDTLRNPFTWIAVKEYRRARKNEIKRVSRKTPK